MAECPPVPAVVVSAMDAAIQAVPDVEVDTNPADPDHDNDSTLGDSDVSTLSTSLKSSIFNHRYENGRRYHGYKDGEYLNPDDDDEQARLDLLHHLFRMMLGGALFTAPIREPENILDVGTGTGIWAIDIADEFPAAQVIGTDLSPIQPLWVSPNCQFYVDDAETDWVYHQKFDYIHCRALVGAIKDFPKLFQQAYENLKPGGWLELQDYASAIRSDDHTIDNAKWTVDWVDDINRGTTMFGKPLNVVHHHKQKLIDAGFTDVREEIRKIPVGRWAKDRKLKEMGAIEQVQMVQAVDAFTPAVFTRVLQYSWDQTQIIMEGVKKELMDRQNHWYITYHFVCGQKPEQ